MNVVALKLKAASRSQLNLLIDKWNFWRQQRREAARARELSFKQETDKRYFALLDQIRRGEHWPTMELLLKTGEWNFDRFRKELLQQLETEVFDKLVWDDVYRFSGRMQRVMLLIFRLWKEPDAQRIFQLLCNDYGEQCIRQGLENVETMWYDIFPSSWFSRTND